MRSHPIYSSEAQNTRVIGDSFPNVMSWVIALRFTERPTAAHHDLQKNQILNQNYPAPTYEITLKNSGAWTAKFLILLASVQNPYTLQPPARFIISNTGQKSKIIYLLIREDIAHKISFGIPTVHFHASWFFEELTMVGIKMSGNLNVLIKRLNGTHPSPTCSIASPLNYTLILRVFRLSESPEPLVEL